MEINLVSCVFVLDSEKNDNIRKNDIKKIKVLLCNDNLPIIKYTGGDIKKQVHDNISKMIGSDIFHLEQVYTGEEENCVDIIYLGITNISNVKKIDKDCQLEDFSVQNNSLVTLGNKKIEYKTIEIELNNNIEYKREFKTNDKELLRILTILLVAYKRIRGNIDHTDIIFKFMGDSFTLEDVRIVYELLSEKTVDKSNFRKRIIKYCEKTSEVNNTKNGYRPSQRYKFKPLKGDIWV